MEGEALPYSAFIKVCPSDDRESRTLRAIYRSLVAEAKSPASLGRIVVKVSLEGECLGIEMKADTESHLRAVVNSYLYLLNAAKVVVDRIDSLVRS